MENVRLHDYDLIIVNSSGGKDSVCALFKVCVDAQAQGYPMDKIVVSHQDLGEAEWRGVKELVQQQADMFGVRVEYSKRKDKNGREETLLEYVKRRGKWPSRSQRWCTSDFKRGPGARVLTSLTKGMGKCKVLYVFGFRAEESPDRKKKEVFVWSAKHSTQKREVFEYLPIHTWSTHQVWNTIKVNELPYHKAYDLGMPRLSCVFCIFSPFDALVLAGRNNPELLQKYVDTERETGHRFRQDFSLGDVQDSIESGYQPKNISNWVM
jgi:3'-phosphoadenosine 5'-phosphosulfate sulfotransferase (PAPS reductase)/FAD synthetase